MPFSTPLRRTAAVLGCTALLAISVRSAAANPVPGFVEHWNTPGTSGWGGGDFYSNPGTGGQLGAGDGFLLYTTPGPSPFFTHNLGSNNPGVHYSGNWEAAGIQTVKFWLDDVGSPNPLEMHFNIGSDTNLWEYNTGFVPPANSWAQFSVDLTTSTGWTQTIGTGTFDNALQNVALILIRHDKAPFVQTPDTITADVGLDELTLIGADNTGVPLAGPLVARPVELAPPSPNPSRGPVALTLQSFDASPVHLDIVDASGRLIRRTVIDGAAAGTRVWMWDGRTDSGASAPAGYYRVRAWGAAGGTSRALVRLAGQR